MSKISHDEFFDYYGDCDVLLFDENGRRYKLSIGDFYEVFKGRFTNEINRGVIKIRDKSGR